jgi:hypothetical protein
MSRINAALIYVGSLWSRLIGTRSPSVGYVVHDPASLQPHDLDDPFFDEQVQHRVGNIIAEGAKRSDRAKDPEDIVGSPACGEPLKSASG